MFQPSKKPLDCETESTGHLGLLRLKTEPHGSLVRESAPDDRDRMLIRYMR